jgi:hypothetical protein
MNSTPKIGDRFASINAKTETFFKSALLILSRANEIKIF